VDEVNKVRARGRQDRRKKKDKKRVGAGQVDRVTRECEWERALGELAFEGHWRMLALRLGGELLCPRRTRARI